MPPKPRKVSATACGLSNIIRPAHLAPELAETHTLSTCSGALKLETTQFLSISKTYVIHGDIY